MEIEELVQRQRDFFRTGRTKDVAFRIAALQKLENSIVKYEKEINEALSLSVQEGRRCMRICTNPPLRAT